ncbi:sigma 54-interacting transcriptional regulator [Leptospirillum ferrooxidans]|uniref:Putative response regulator receiver protein n=1 Tax=Leptospirillum ferrooxidans (strain C2-3) TaxID=1162668 RepID=I0IQP7_LEPFC|nr:sigma-54 dependent transcriptional regulator [Leptospirillum ferrooxidans]MDA8060792.1 sigma-54 dependent transcriptional regulator [Nitrospiraceae bacterium]BAM07596.1 putative response regulator receiver protein [Leptospirillum ferrooxidans C2-3]
MNVESGFLRMFLKTRSPVFSRVIEQMRLLAPHDIPVVVEGETGTGKELFVQCLHELSPRNRGNLVPVNMGGIPQGLFEEIFFGHVRGAFTGADMAKEGLFAAANGGTLFLDEFNAMLPEHQPKLLRVLETSTYLSVGGLETKKTSARVVVASNDSLSDLKEAGDLREDLFFRLSTFRVILPPLRERREDIVPLFQYFLAQYSDRFKKSPPSYSRTLLDRIESHEWKGNIRELSRKTERAALFCGAGPIEWHHFGVSAEEEDVFPLFGVALEGFERGYIQDAIRKSGGNVRLGSELTGLSSTTYKRKVRQHSPGK